MRKITLTILLFLAVLSLQAQTVFINELHYDNAGSDVNEGFEIAGPAGTDLTGWTVEFYNGSNGSDYGTINLSGILPDEGSGFGAIYFLASGMQNGAPDGLALIDATNIVVQFLSYEGSFVATSGTANGMTSIDIGVSEPSSSPIGESLQLIGTGSEYADFSWTGPTTSSIGLINSGQTFVGSGSGASPTIICPADIIVNNATGTCSAAVSFTGFAIDPEDGNISSSIVATPESGSIFNVGVRTVVLSVTDSDGNTVTCDFTVTVLDTEAPTAVCQDVTLELDPITGTVTLTPAEIDNGSSDLCGPVTLTLDISTFDCSMIGANNVVLTATDSAGNSTSCSAIVTVQDTTAPIISCLGEASGPSVFINEIHYDNAGTDEGEAIEIAGPSGTDLNSYSIVLYNGNNGTEYNTVNLSGIIDDEGNGFGAVNFEIEGIQNGAPDGIALVNNGNVIQFLSYEGSFTAVDGVAAGMTSTDIGVSEESNSPVGESLQLSGTGTYYADFVWNAPTAATPGTLNAGQTYVAPTSSSVDVVLDENGLASIDPNTLLQSVDEVCGYIITVNGSTTADFTCADIGENIVEVTVTDDSGNVSTCFATVNVI
ncbi:HYR domain-containing protein, partial [Aequorivita sp. SDUM287046]